MMSLSTPENELINLSAWDLARLIRQKEISSYEVVKAYLERIDKVNPDINAFCTILNGSALMSAIAADKAVQNGENLGPLHGIPVALKDLTPTKNIRTTRGSKLFEKDVPKEDALLVQRIKKAGGIILGKTNTPEFGHKGVTNNRLFGPTRNPRNLEKTAGGSSGGSAAAVAAGLVPLAEGSDGAGSIRIPSSVCGVFGFKPSFGRVPDVAGAFSSHSPFFHNGPIARSVPDAALLYEVMAGSHYSDPFSVPTSSSVLSSLEEGIKGMKIAFSPDLGYFEVDPEVQQICKNASFLFSNVGAEVEEVDVDFDYELEGHFMVLWCAKLASTYGDLPKEDLEKLEPRVQELIEKGKQLSAVDYGKANLAREKAWNQLLQIHRKYDLLLCPTTAIPAFSIERDTPPLINNKEVHPLLGWFLTYPFNLTGNPAASIPCGLSEEGLPIGLQIIGRRLEDDKVLRAARSFEKQN